jgi:hypothetical protein
MDLAGDVSLEAAQDLFLGPGFGGPAGEVVLGGLVAVHADQGDAPQGAVGVAIARRELAVQVVDLGPQGLPATPGIAALPWSRTPDQSAVFRQLGRLAVRTRS